ncbi:MAG: peptidoglycan DD-metalloendopeptidase family protein [Anaerolineae bacterium]|nr:peptidoglycan DD-metalloendopeptidase family protein [Anaerolineae bacterium]MDW8071029.1 peptidoglycan DD-metalloendopeptidase family protein [Anaerolineae bacterium]
MFVLVFFGGVAQAETPSPSLERPFILPFSGEAGPSTWLLAQPYGNTVGAFRQRHTTYAGSGGIHFGVDLAAPCGTPVVAMADGVVFAVDALRFGSAPHNLMIDHPDLGYATFYGHLLERPSLKPGQFVKAGDLVGLSGDPAETCFGRPHLHFEIRDLSHVRKYNPVKLVQADWDNLALAGAFSQAFQYDLDEPRKWQHLDDQPEASAGGPLLNDFANPWPPEFPANMRLGALLPSDAPLGCASPSRPTASTQASIHPTRRENTIPSSSLQMLTTGGCCTQPFWSPDARQVLFIDRPSPARSAAIWAVSVDAPEMGPYLFSEHIGFYTTDLSYRIVLRGKTTFLEELACPAGLARRRWAVPAGGRPVFIAPHRTRIAWQVSNDNLPIERRVAEIWVANLDGSGAREVAKLARGSILGWATDTVLIVSGRENLSAREQVLWALSLPDGDRLELARSDRLRGGSLSPQGTWLVYSIALSQKRDQNGLWLVRVDGTQRHQLPSALFGAHRWRDDHRLLIVPLRPAATFHELWEFDAQNGTGRALTHPETIPFKIANNDWAVAPDGRSIVFVSALDRNLWLLRLPD